MRILYVIPQLSGGGAERHLSYLAPVLVKRGHNIHLAFLKEGPDKPSLNGVVLHRLKSRSNYDPFLLFQLISLIRKIKPDIVHTWLLQMDVLGGIASLLTRSTWIFSEQSSGIGYPNSIKQILHDSLCSNANAIVSNSQGGDAYWKNKLPNTNRFIVQNGLPIESIYKIAPYLPIRIKDADKPIVLYVGRLISQPNEEKNVKRLLEIINVVRQQLTLNCIICGEGPQKSELKALSHNLEMNNDVYFTGHLPVASVWALMKKASLFISLSKFEGCPNAVMEAMACGCPLVLSDIPGHREILNDKSALFVDPSNIHQTANAILKILNDPSIKRNLSLIAKQRARHLTIARMVEKWEKIYVNLI